MNEEQVRGIARRCPTSGRKTPRRCDAMLTEYIDAALGGVEIAEARTKAA